METKNGLNDDALTTFFEGKVPGILFFPDYSMFNPYQHLLYQSISHKLQLSVYGFEMKSFSKRILKKYRENCDYLHIHWIHPFFNLNDDFVFYSFLDPILYAKNIGYKVIWTIHNLLSHESQNESKEIEYYSIFSELCDTLLVHGEKAKRMVCETYKVALNKVFIVPHGSYQNYYPNQIERKKARENLGIGDNELTFIFFGMIKKYKGVETLLDIFKTLREKHANIRLIIAGRIKEKDKDIYSLIHQYTKPSNAIICVNRFIEDNEIQSYFNASDIFVFPCKRILTSGSVILALSFYKPVIVPDGILDNLVNRKVGFLYQDQNDLTSIMSKCIEDWNSGGKKLDFHRNDFAELLRELEWDQIVETYFAPCLLELKKSDTVEWKSIGYTIEEKYCEMLKDRIKKKDDQLKKQEATIRHIYRSWSYRIGNCFIQPIDIGLKILRFLDFKKQMFKAWLGYRFSKTKKESDTFVLYRILGNDLPPRHQKGQTYNNLKFTLEHEPDLECCRKIWVLNRIFDPQEQKKIEELLLEYGREYFIIPFREEEYEKIGFTFDGLPDARVILSAPDGEHEKAFKLKIDSYIMSHKNLYAMNNNGARNIALKHGKEIAKWVLPWDGNCFLTLGAWHEISSAIKKVGWLKYFIVPMARIFDNAILLQGSHRPDAREEPQIIFRKDTKEIFDESFPYGRIPKLEFLKRIRGYGPRDNTVLPVYPWEKRIAISSPERYQCAHCGWVARLNSGNKEAESSSVEREIVRDLGIVQFVKEIDLSLLHKKTNGTTNAYYNEKKIEKAGQCEKMVHAVKCLADSFWENKPCSVVDKTTLPPSGNIHDYWHPSPYYWPNPDTKDGQPYIHRDGERVPGTRLYEKGSEKYDRTSLQKMFDETTTLALAYHFTRESKYAEKGAEFVRTWFIRRESQMTPHLKYSHVRMGLSDQGANTGIIETKDFYFFLDAVRMIGKSQAWTKDDDTAMKRWCRSFLDWLLKSDQGKKERQARNNHGICYDLQVASLAAYLEDLSLLYDITKTACARSLEHIAVNGTQPHEMQRTNSFHYCAFNLQSWLNLAIVLENTMGFDLWNLCIDGRGSIQQALKWLLPYYQKKWPYRQIDAFDRERLVPLFHLSKGKYPEIRERFKAVFPDIVNARSCYFPHDGIPVFWSLNVVEPE